MTGDGTNCGKGTLQELFRLEPSSMHVSQPSTESRPRILLVEDDEDIAGLVKLHLAELEADLEHCNRGDTAAARIADERWNLLILDIRLPGQSGLDLCRSLR